MSFTNIIQRRRHDTNNNSITTLIITISLFTTRYSSYNQYRCTHTHVYHKIRQSSKFSINQSNIDSNIHTHRTRVSYVNLSSTRLYAQREMCVCVVQRGLSTHNQGDIILNLSIYAYEMFRIDQEYVSSLSSLAVIIKQVCQLFEDLARVFYDVNMS